MRCRGCGAHVPPDGRRGQGQGRKEQPGSSWALQSPAERLKGKERLALGSGSRWVGQSGPPNRSGRRRGSRRQRGKDARAGTRVSARLSAPFRVSPSLRASEEVPGQPGSGAPAPGEVSTALSPSSSASTLQPRLLGCFHGPFPRSPCPIASRSGRVCSPQAPPGPVGPALSTPPLRARSVTRAILISLDARGG